MNMRQRLRVMMVVILSWGVQAYAVSSAPTPADGVAADAEQMLTEGNTTGAIAKYEELIEKYKTYESISAAKYNLGYAYYMVGKYDKAIEMFRNLAKEKNLVDAELKEQCAMLIANTLAAKAGTVKDEERDKLLEEATKAFDDYLGTYKESKSRPDALYGKASCLLQLGKLDEAQKTLEEFFAVGQQSTLKDDAIYLLGRVYAAKARKYRVAKDEVNARKAVAEARKNFDILKESRQDPVLANEASFSAGEALANAEAFPEGMSYLREVKTKQLMSDVQADAVEQFRKAYMQAVKTGDKTRQIEYKRQKEKAEGRLKSIQEGPNLFLSAQQLIARCFYEQKKYDEVVLLNRHFMSHYDPDQKKRAAYIIVKSFLAKQDVEKTIKEYEDFAKTYPKDKMCEDQIFGIAELLYRKNKYLDCIQWVEKLEALNPDPKSQFLEDGFYMAMGAATASGDAQLGEQWTAKFTKTFPTSDKMTAALFSKAYSSYGKKDYEKAIPEFKEYLEKTKQGDNVESAEYLVIMCLFELKKYDDTLKALDAFAAKYKTSKQIPNVLYQKAKALEAKRDIPGADKVYEQVVKDFPNEKVAPYAQYGIALNLLSLGPKHHGEAAPAFRRFIDLFPTHPLVPTAYLYQAEILKAQGKLDEAEKAYRELIEKFPGDDSSAEAFVAIGSMLFEAATKMAQKADKLSPEKQVIWKDLANKAIESHEQVLKRFPKNAVVDKALSEMSQIWQTRIMAKFAKQEEAQAYFDGLANAAPAGDTSLAIKVGFTLGALQGQMGEKEKSLETLDRVYEKAKAGGVSLPNDGYRQYGNALIDSGKFDKAIEVFEKQLGERQSGGDDSGVAEADLGLGTTYFQKGDIAKAGGYFQEIHDKYPWHKRAGPLADFYLCWIMEKQQKFDEAIKFYKVLVPKTVDMETKVQIWTRLGYACHGKAGASAVNQETNLNEALGWFLRVGTGYNAYPKYASECLYMAATICEKGNVPKDPADPKTHKPATFYDKTMAIDFYKRCIKEFPETPWAAKSKERLKPLGL